MGRYHEKVNTSKKQMKLRDKLEELGHTNVEVWWEPVSGSSDMGGYDGGFIFCSDTNTYEPLGYSFDEAWEYLCDSPWFDNTPYVGLQDDYG